MRAEGAYLVRSTARPRRVGLALMALAIAGCAAMGGGPPLPPTSVQTVEYYPFQVKGYQNTYPHRTIVVLLPADARDLAASSTAPLGGQPAAGIVTDQSELIIQRLYSQPLATIVQ